MLEPGNASFCNAGVMDGFEIFGSMFALVPESLVDELARGAGSAVTKDLAWGALKLPAKAGVAFRVLGHGVESVRAKMREFHSLVRERALGRPLPPEFLWR